MSNETAKIMADVIPTTFLTFLVEVHIFHEVQPCLLSKHKLSITYYSVHNVDNLLGQG